MRLNKNLLAAMAIGALVSTAEAQTVKPGAAGSDAATPSESGDQLQEIIVTAQRRVEDVQHAALAIDVVSPQALGLENTRRATDLQNLAPALQISENGNGQQSLYLRGVGTSTGNSYQDAGVAFSVDGIFIARPSSMTNVFYDLDRVEVLKGPQGTLYGRNATGGAINVIPNQPRLGVTSADVALTLGNYTELHPEGDVNLALTDASAARFAFTSTTHSGYQTDNSGDARSYAGRLQYLYQWGDTLSVRLAGDYANESGRGAAGTLVALQNPFTGAFTPSPLPRDVGSFDPRYTAVLANQYSFLSGRYFGPIDGRLLSDNFFRGVLSEIIWHSPIGTLTVLPAYRNSTLDNLTAEGGFGESAREHDSQISTEVRLASADQGMVRWLLGGYYLHEIVNAAYQFNFQALSSLQGLETSTLSKAGFGRLTIAPIDEFRISAGMRYTDDRKTFDGVANTLVDICVAPAIPLPACASAPLIPATTDFASLASQLQLIPFVPNKVYGSTLPGAARTIFTRNTIPIDNTQNYTKVTWHGGLEYDLTKDSLLYASWDSGYHAGGFAFAQVKPTYEPETISAYSIGSKNRFLNNTLQVNLEGFYWRYTNQQIPHLAKDTNGAQVFYTENAGSSTIKGVEVQLKYLLTPHTVFNIDAQYVGAAYDAFTYRTPAGANFTPPVTGCPVSQTDATHYTVNCAGKTTLQSPKWSGNIGLQQTLELSAYSLIGAISAHAQSDSVLGFEMLPIEVQKSYAEADLSLALVPANGQWSLTAFVNNLTDKRPYGSEVYTPSLIGGFVGGTVGPPRTGGVRATYKF
jgi:iron complex outermembrane receptor protein